jgi:acyl-CoA dehydrogenase
MAPDDGNMHMLELIVTEEQKPSPPRKQKRRYLAPLAAGDTRSCFGMTEPHPCAGSDPSALRTTVVKRGDRWVIDGQKRFTSGAIGADFGIVMARTDDGGASMFLVDIDNPGIRVGEPIHTIDRYIDGGHPHVYLEGCEVGDDAVIGEVGSGLPLCPGAPRSGSPDAQHALARAGPPLARHRAGPCGVS